VVPGAEPQVANLRPDGIASSDGYLLDGRPSKDDAVAAVLADRSSIDGHKRSTVRLICLGRKVADEALIALRLALIGEAVDDDGVLRAARAPYRGP